MDNDPQSALGYINRGIAAHQNENNAEARRYFAQALLLDPTSELGWLWFSEVTDDPGEQRYCLDRARRINPDTAGNTKNALLSVAKAQIPQEIADVAQPPLPPSFTGNQTVRTVIPRLRVSQIHPLRTAAAVAREQGITWSEKHRWVRALILVAFLTIVVSLGAFAISHVSDTGPQKFIAVVGPMSGPDQTIGDEMRHGAQLSVDAYNRNRVGPKIGLIVLDDRNNPALAVQRANEIVADSRIVMVIGHGNSTTSVAASPIYQHAGIAAITSQATSNELSKNPDYFRTVFDNKTEAELLTVYLQNVLKVETISLIAGPGLDEQSLSDAMAIDYAHGGNVRNIWQLTTDHRDVSIQAIVDGIGADPHSGTIVLALTEQDAYDVLLAIRHKGLDPSMIGGESMGSTSFSRLFSTQPEEKETPGFFSEGLFAISPLIFDSMGGDSLAFNQNFAKAYGIQPGWRGAKAYDAVTAGIWAISNASISGKTSDIENDRKLVIMQLHSLNSPKVALRGLTGMLFFDVNGDAPQGFSVGQFTSGILSSAPTQYRIVANRSEYNVAEEIRSGRAIEIHGQLFRQYRVVYVGLEMIELRDLDTVAQSYTADFFFYFRYSGDDAPLNITFSNATDAGLGIGKPLESSTASGGLTYKLFRVEGTFDEPMNFESYPWDRHTLTIRFQNLLLTQTDVVYVPDVLILATSKSDRLASGFDRSRPFNRIPSWIADDLTFSQVAVTALANQYEITSVVQYSEFRAGVELGRSVLSFLIKNLLPLLLLALVTYIALWFPAEQASTRIGFSITSLLASSVMLGSISNQLPNIGYTVAIEWGFYVYIGLSAMLVLLNVAVDRSFRAKYFARVRKLDIAIRTLYPLAILATIAVYWIKYS